MPATLKNKRTAHKISVDLLMQQWGLDVASARLQQSVRRVLNDLANEALLRLTNEPRLQVIVPPEDGWSVWAYFPIHRRRKIAKRLHPRPETRILLVIPERGAQTREDFEVQLQHHLGHAMLFLRNPRARNHCVAALREWDKNTIHVPCPCCGELTPVGAARMMAEEMAHERKQNSPKQEHEKEDGINARERGRAPPAASPQDDWLPSTGPVPASAQESAVLEADAASEF